MATEINRGYLDHIRRWSGGRAAFHASGIRPLIGNLLRLAAVPFLLIMAVGLIVRLRVALLFRRKSTSVLHDEALPHVDAFVRQYPLHLYPIVAKAIELSYLKRLLPTLVNPDTEVVEVAIGEGTLSSRVFGDDVKLTGLDLNPYSLAKAVKLPHVRKAVICDGLNPPVRKGAFDLLISNNFLHHVTEKERTIGNWSRVAPLLLFNENTPYWASGWTRPYLRKRFGSADGAKQAAARIEKDSMQHLEHVDALAAHVRRHCTIREQRSFMSERTFFYCSLFSFLMHCYGPPTPSFLKKLFLGVLSPIAIPLTRTVARLLIRFDAGEDRSTDTFITFLCESATARAKEGNVFVCPRCGGAIGENRCASCGTTFPSSDGMLFLLPPEFESVATEYRPEAGKGMPTEHL